MSLDKNVIYELSALIRKMGVILTANSFEPMSDETYGVEMFRNQQERIFLETNPPSQEESKQYLLAVLREKKNKYSVEKAGLELLKDAIRLDLANIDSEMTLLDAVINRIEES